tara:strand:+ start:77 stop:412 length:336 start_codon:yes stop_codon:yes gene_type:complete
MIDKYEGHTEDIERWQGLSNSLPHWSNESDKHLMRDAPLLLEEVKRLREQLMKAKKWVHYHCQAYTSAVSMLRNYEDYMTKDIPYWNYKHIERYDDGCVVVVDSVDDEVIE